MNVLKNLWNWLVYSSNNPEKLALTLKAGVASLVFFGIDQVWGDALADNFVGLLVSVLQVVSYAGLIWGGVRKVGVTANQKLRLGL